MKTTTFWVLSEKTDNWLWLNSKLFVSHTDFAKLKEVRWENQLLPAEGFKPTSNPWCILCRAQWKKHSVYVFTGAFL